MTNANRTKKEAMQEKIKGLLATAKGSNFKEEAEQALLTAQRLMAKYGIENEDVKSNDEKIGEVMVLWKGALRVWEKALANVIADNFKVQLYYSQKLVNGKKGSTIMFYGYGVDVETAIDTYNLALDSMNHLVKRYIEGYYDFNGMKKDRALTSKLKESYMLGFVKGLKDKFKAQKESMEKEFGLIITTPKAVIEAWKVFSQDFGTARTRSRSIHSSAYNKGYEKGNEMNTRKALMG